MLFCVVHVCMWWLKIQCKYFVSGGVCVRYVCVVMIQDVSGSFVRIVCVVVCGVQCVNNHFMVIVAYDACYLYCMMQRFVMFGVGGGVCGGSVGVCEAGQCGCIMGWCTYGGYGGDFIMCVLWVLAWVIGVGVLICEIILQV